MVKCESEPAGPTLGDPGEGGVVGLLDTAGFRLDEQLQDHDPVGDPLETLTSTSASSYSIYKQRIDSMFDETRSQLSYGYGTTTASLQPPTQPPLPPLLPPLLPPPPPPLPAR